MIAVSDLGKSFGPQTLFEGVSIQFNPGNRYGLVGANGSGKSTFLKILAGDDIPSEGTIAMPKRLKLGVLKQDHFQYEHMPILEVAMMGNHDVWEAMVEKEHLLANADQEFDADRYSELEDLILRNDGYTLESRAGEVLEGLGIQTEIHRQPLSTLSGGFKLRVLLAQVLASDPGVLLLDEPTNHLDILSIRWLEKFLDEYKGLAIVISHDQRFLDNVATHTLDVDYQHRRALGVRQELVWGAGYRVTHDQVGNSPGVAFLPTQVTENLLSAFAQDEITLERHLRLTVGTKLEHNHWTGFEVQPSVRLSWVPDDRRTLWGAISRAVRTPTRYDEDIVFYTAAGTPLLEGSNAFVSEELLAYEIGYRTQVRTGLTVDVTTYYNVYDHLRSNEPAAPPAAFPYHFANRLSADTWGAELRVSAQAASWWRLHAGYAYYGKSLSLDPRSYDPTGGKNEGDDPANRFVLRSLMDLPDRFELDGTLRYVARLPAPVVPAYTELDLRLGWNATDALELSLTGQNLLHARHPEFGPPSPLRQEVQRSVYGKVTWRF